jgi:hypothetical protein
MLLAGMLAVAAPSSPADARDGYRHRAGYPGPGYVVAESRWGKGTVTGAVRPGRHGWQVRLPRGTWIDCGRSCSDTLRRATVDFWESNGPQAKDTGPGYFNFELRW